MRAASPFLAPSSQPSRSALRPQPRSRYQWMTFHNASRPFSSVEQVNGSQAMSGMSWHLSKRPFFCLLGLGGRLGQASLSSTTLTSLEPNIHDLTGYIEPLMDGQDPSLVIIAIRKVCKLQCARRCTAIGMLRPRNAPGDPHTSCDHFYRILAWSLKRSPP